MDSFFFNQIGHRRVFWPIYVNFAHDTWTLGAAGAVSVKLIRVRNIEMGQSVDVGFVRLASARIISGTMWDTLHENVAASARLRGQMTKRTMIHS